VEPWSTARTVWRCLQGLFRLTLHGFCCCCGLEELRYAMMSVGNDIARASWRACMLAVESSNTGWGMGEAAVHCRSATTANLLRHLVTGRVSILQTKLGNREGYETVHVGL